MVELALQLLLLAQATVAPQPTAADVLRGAKNAIIGAQSVAYVVTRDYTDSSGNKVKGRTLVLIAKSPFGFRSEHRRDDGSHSETAVSDGKTTRTLTDGKPDQNPTFGPEDPQWSMNIGGNADSDVAATWHLFLDADYFQRAIESGRILYLWGDEVQGEPCSVIVYARDHWTDYFWISTKTGFPRATQRLSMSRGPTRWVHVTRWQTFISIRKYRAMPSDWPTPPQPIRQIPSPARRRRRCRSRPGAHPFPTSSVSDCPTSN
jgi:hypothetical protein